MAQKPTDYYLEKNSQYGDQLRRLVAELPSFMAAYISNQGQSKSARTRIAYTREMINFLKYVRDNNPLYKDLETSQIPFECMEHLTFHDIDDYMTFLKDSRGIGDSARKRTISCLNSYFKYEVTQKTLASNPVEAADKPKLKEKPIKRLNVDQVGELLTGVEISNSGSVRSNAFTVRTQLRDTAIVTLLLGTGIRISELVGLDKNSVKFADNSITVVRKGGNTEKVYFNEEVATALSDYIKKERPRYLATEDEPALFLSNRKKRMAVRSIEEMLQKYGEANLSLEEGETLHPHLLRRTYGTALYNATGDIRLVADTLGHKNINTTQKHYAAMEEEHRKQNKDIYLYRKDGESINHPKDGEDYNNN